MYIVIDGRVDLNLDLNQRQISQESDFKDFFHDLSGNNKLLLDFD